MSRLSAGKTHPSIVFSDDQRSASLPLCRIWNKRHVLVFHYRSPATLTCVGIEMCAALRLISFANRSKAHAWMDWRFLLYGRLSLATARCSSKSIERRISLIIVCELPNALLRVIAEHLKTTTAPLHLLVEIEWKLFPFLCANRNFKHCRRRLWRLRRGGGGCCCHKYIFHQVGNSLIAWGVSSNAQFSMQVLHLHRARLSRKSPRSSPMIKKVNITWIELADKDVRNYIETT